MNLGKAADRITGWGFFALFFAVPLFFTTLNFELFEYNKMMLTYGLTTIIVGAWGIKMIATQKVIFRRTLLDIPILFFLLTQIAGLVFSIDPHVSFWGYYSRFHGGLLSTITYILLFYAFVSNMIDMDGTKVKKLITVALASGALVAAYGVLERLGIDKNYWVQDVQNRVFSTLGQPNWLAAYMAILLPISIVKAFPYANHVTERILARDKIQSLKKTQGFNLLRTTYYVLLPMLFYTTLVFTKSRSGFIGTWIAMGVFWLTLFAQKVKDQRSKVKSVPQSGIHDAVITQKFANSIGTNQKLKPESHIAIKPYSHLLRLFLILNSLFLILTFFFGTPFGQLNTFTAPELFRQPVAETANAELSPQPARLAAKRAGTLLETGVTGSGDIRKIVWSGALDIAREFPLFGTGNETFTYSYFKYRPVAHNATSEWDFLYNKAHNEYLNFAANNGFVGLGAYILLIGWFVAWMLIKIKNQMATWLHGHMAENANKNSKNKNHSTIQPFNHSSIEPDQKSNNPMLIVALFSGWISILVTNFFGFSVVVVALFFFLIPAMLFALVYPEKQKQITNTPLATAQKIAIGAVLLLITYFLSQLIVIWNADRIFATGTRYASAAYYQRAYPLLQQATKLNPNEPVYHDKLSSTAAILAKASFESQDATSAAEFMQTALEESQKALETSPQNVLFWKTRARILVRLAEIDPDQFSSQALKATLIARKLSPTDPKLSYNVGLLYSHVGDNEQAIALLEETKNLKVDFRDAYYALGLFYRDEGDIEKARENVEFILERLNPNDKEAQGLLESL